VFRRQCVPETWLEVLFAFDAGDLVRMLIVSKLQQAIESVSKEMFLNSSGALASK
jgi:sulfite exporter TauE/SafE